jgi:hypothetical protein
MFMTAEKREEKYPQNIARRDADALIGVLQNA